VRKRAFDHQPPAGRGVLLLNVVCCSRRSAGVTPACFRSASHRRFTRQQYPGVTTSLTDPHAAVRRNTPAAHDGRPQACARVY